MKTKCVLNGPEISLRQITLQDCNNNYVKWLNDPEVNQFLETRWYKQDLDSIKDFVNFQLENDHSFLFAIILNTSNCHIGNIKIGPINKHHNHADISYFIGEKKLWGKGLMTEAVSLACKYAFEVLKLHKLEAGVYCSAVGSWKALEKNGFKREGVFREHSMYNNKYIDVYRYGLLKIEYFDSVKL